MEIFPPGKILNIMRYRKPVMTASGLIVLASIVLLFAPGPKFGTDFAGGTELELQFRGRVPSTEVRQQFAAIGYDGADVISVQGKPNRYIVRMRQTSALPASEQRRIDQGTRQALGGQSAQVTDFSFSEGGDKITLRTAAPVEPAAVQQALTTAGARVVRVNAVGSSEENRYEAHLEGIGGRIVEQLRERLAERGPDEPLRVEWVGPRAGQQLRRAAAEAVGYALIFIMIFIAFRFDIRFAPGAIVSLAHDVLITLGFYVLFGREVALTTVAACLTILGYSINDTIVVYDRIRENLGRERGKTFAQIIDISTSQVLSRSIITSGTTIVSIVPFLYFGTPTVRDIAFAFVVGMAFGTYSSIYIAAPITEWFDRNVFRRAQPQA